MPLNWIWSDPHRDYYYVTYDTSGQAIYHWAKQPQASVPDPAHPHESAIPHLRVDSASYPHPDIYQGSSVKSDLGNSELVPPEPVSEETRRRHPDLISGTPELGWYEKLDSSYRMRNGAEARQFFRKGRVFAMLYTEAAGATSGSSGVNDAFTVVKFNEYVYSQIRRFVIVDVKRNFVYACAISTYSGRGTNKPGCDPSEHAIAYLSGSIPQYVSGEGPLKKLPIEIEPDNSGISMSSASRIRFGKTYPIEWNVRVKGIGMVIPEDLSKLHIYWMEENNHYSSTTEEIATGTIDSDFNKKRKLPEPLSTAGNASLDISARIAGIQIPMELSFHGKRPDQQPAPTRPESEPTSKTDASKESTTTIAPIDDAKLHSTDTPSTRSTIAIVPADDVEVRSTDASGVATIVDNEREDDSQSVYQVIQKPRGFFKKGRLFRMPWPEPGGECLKDGAGPPVHVEDRIFVVIRPRATYCLCLPVNTYEGQATSKLDLAAQDHAAVVPLGGEAQLHEQEQPLTKSPMFVTIENENVSVDSMARINFAKVYTIEHGVRVQSIGRIVSDSIWQMEKYFTETLRLDQAT